ncbi:acyl-CoA N-acyltransferase [Fusarium austroafricanum]|uniref:Acyl-CoA N-acyltransferase n=1 Tax=Fusarium austroafricanum TaxID=2364996 RepID=A0A8H4KTD3_9HYPO|nr:acyl-CoA N-acyltransferase [Fusarium austroafricanum]
MSPAVRIRRAERADLDALTTLILTSFRQFQLFAYLYSPLQTCPISASDTLWYWRRRLRLEMLDPSTDVLVADISVADERPDATDDGESKRLHEWVLARRGQKDPQIRTIGKLGNGGSDGDLNDRLVVGFAIWNLRKPDQGEETESGIISKRPKQSWAAWLEDQDPKAYTEYTRAEDRLANQCYSSETVYYLDNLTVDFRFQRRGIGKELVQKGLKEAARLDLPAMTEASIRGESLYYKMGFEKMAIWDVCGFRLPVMRWTQPTQTQASH